MPTRREFLMQAATAGVIATASVHVAESTVEDMAGSSMKTYKIPHTDLEVSRLAYGNAMLGASWRSPDFVTSSTRAVQTAYDNGITFFDTADIYGEGRSEVALGEFLKRSPGRRDKIVIQSKCGMQLPDGWAPGDPIGSNTFVGIDLSRGHIVSAVERTLKRLGTDRLDILLLHFPDPLAHLEEVAQAFDDLRSSGKVRHFGVSNHNVVQIQLLKKYVQQPLVANQIWLGLAHYSPMSDRSSFGALVDYCRLENIQIQAFSPLKGGANYTDRPILLTPSPSATPEITKVIQTLADIARMHQSTPAVVMLAWLLRHPAGIVPIIGATRPEHIVENCSADRVNLTSQEWTTVFRVAAAIQSRD